MHFGLLGTAHLVGRNCLERHPWTRTSVRKTFLESRQDTGVTQVMGRWLLVRISPGESYCQADRLWGHADPNP